MSDAGEVHGVNKSVPGFAHHHPGHSHDHGDPHSHSHGHEHRHGGHGHGHGHAGHGHHAHAHQAGEDQWDGQKYIAKPGAKEVAVVSADRILYALKETGISGDETKTLNLLEVGCGLVTANLAPHFSHIHAIDVSPSMLLAFSTVNTSPSITHSLHYLNPSSATEFLQPVPSPLPAEPERRLTPPRNVFDVAVMNLVLHHVNDWSDIMRGIQGLLGGGRGGKGGWFVGTEFGIGEDGTDIVMEARAKIGLAKGDKNADHASVHHGAMTPAQMVAKLQSYGFEEAHAEIKGDMKLWPDAPAVPCLVFWAKAPAAESGSETKQKL